MLEQEGCNLIVAAFEVSNEKGVGFLENIDQECPEMELADREIPFVPQSEILKNPNDVASILSIAPWN
ncbi:MAG: nuclease superfamily [Verrucomicrobiota bacterium]|jgi:hypothetical protein|nr:nuclease superfamily [Verrucomicrobiota bacterium]